MAAIKIFEKDNKEPTTVNGRTVDDCVDILVEKGMIDLSRYTKKFQRNVT